MKLEAGDTIIRMLGGSLPMPLKVTAISENEIICGAWTFDKVTGAEIDHDLCWGPQYGRTGSYIKMNDNPTERNE